MKKRHVVVVGSHVQGLFMRVSRFPQADETVLGGEYKEALDGGKGSHQAIACSRLGLPTSFIGRIGKDRLGDVGASWMAEAGVDLTCLFRSEQTATGCGFVMINPDGVAAITTAMGANAELSTDDIDRAAALFHMAALVLITFEIPISTALYAAKKAKEAKAFTVLTPGPAQELPDAALADIDLLVPNRGEASTLLGQRFTKVSPSDVARQLAARFGVDRIVITMGAEGALVWDRGQTVTVPAFKVDVLDTPGAGDAFTAGLAAGLLHQVSLEDAARYGCLVAARAVTIRESVPGFGTTAEIETFAKENNFKMPQSLRSFLSIS